jgi:16S rRNA (cytidine1402-2'-O)-methyltransferase
VNVSDLDGPISQCTIAGVQSRSSPGRLCVVATPIGNLEDVTLRALRVLREVNLIAAEDTRRTAKLLAHAGIETSMISLHAHNEHDRVPRLLERLSVGDHVALVTDAGTPLLSDPGAGLVRAALARGIRVEAVPGPSAVIASLMMTGEGAEGFTFLGFPPVKSGQRRSWLLAASAYPHPVVFFEAPHRVARTLADLRDGTGGHRQIRVCREMTKIHEELVQGSVDEVLAHPSVQHAQGEFTLVLLPGSAEPLEGEVTDEMVWSEFCSVTEKSSLKRREAVAVVARRMGLSTRDAYAALERHRAAVVLGASS